MQVATPTNDLSAIKFLWIDVFKLSKINCVGGIIPYAHLKRAKFVKKRDGQKKEEY
jgi:hypothetical protein